MAGLKKDYRPQRMQPNSPVSHKSYGTSTAFSVSASFFRNLLRSKHLGPSQKLQLPCQDLSEEKPERGTADSMNSTWFFPSCSDHDLGGPGELR